MWRGEGGGLVPLGRGGSPEGGRLMPLSDFEITKSGVFGREDSVPDLLSLLILLMMAGFSTL